MDDLRQLKHLAANSLNMVLVGHDCRRPIFGKIVKKKKLDSVKLALQDWLIFFPEVYDRVG